MRLALLTATLYRQPLHVRGASPCAARSWLISACCVELTTIDGCDAGGRAAGGSPAAGLEGAAISTGLGGAIVCGGTGTGAEALDDRPAAGWRAARRRGGAPGRARGGGA